MQHSFDVEVAKSYGIECAVIFQNIGYWVQHNKENESNFYDGHYWTYNSSKAFENIFPYMNYQKIGRALLKLEDSGLIKSGNYNRSSFDKTKWYTLTDIGYSIYQNRNIDLSNLINREIKSDQPIPYINTDVKPEEKHIYAQKASDEIFERLWKLYPCKRGKGQVSDKRKRDIANLIGEEQFGRCIQRYMKEHEKLSSSGKFCPEWMNGSTFFHSGYIDYLDENCTTEQEKKTAKRKDEDPPIDEWTEQ